MKELARTNKNIFSWLKPTPAPMLKRAKVLEMENMDEIENMDMVDTVQEERLEARETRGSCAGGSVHASLVSLGADMCRI